jgi:hypothetical protein
MIYSLGFSCFSKHSIQQFSLDHRSNPFDYLITTKAFLLSWLCSVANDDDLGGFLEKHLDFSESKLFMMSREGTDGILLGEESDGIYLWHAFPRDGNKTLKGWENSVIEVRSKYEFMLKRLAGSISSLGQGNPKNFIISNTQFNLDQFGEEGKWGESFSFDPPFLRSLLSELRRITRGSFKLVLVVRNLHNFLEICSQFSSDSSAPEMILVFGGITQISPCLHIQQLLREVLFTSQFPAPNAPDIAGVYDNGYHILRVCSAYGDSRYAHYLVHDTNDDILAVITCTPHGCYSVFNEIRRFSMVVVGETLYFSNKTRWRRIREKTTKSTF